MAARFNRALRPSLRTRYVVHCGGRYMRTDRSAQVRAAPREQPKTTDAMANWLVGNDSPLCLQVFRTRHALSGETLPRSSVFVSRPRNRAPSTCRIGSAELG